jgi:hypothetical protein
MCQVLRLTTSFLRCVPALFRSRNNQAVVELALRQQLATFALKRPEPRITWADRNFWIFLSRIWLGWKEALVIVQPDTVVREATSEEVKDLRSENRELKGVVAEITLKNRILKKSLTGHGEEEGS